MTKPVKQVLSAHPVLIIHRYTSLTQKEIKHRIVNDASFVLLAKSQGKLWLFKMCIIYSFDRFDHK